MPFTTCLHTQMLQCLQRAATSNFTDGTAASGELMPGDWGRLVARDTNLRDHGRLSSTRASRDAVAVRNDLK